MPAALRVVPSERPRVVGDHGVHEPQPLVAWVAQMLVVPVVHLIEDESARSAAELPHVVPVRQHLQEDDVLYVAEHAPWIL